MEQHQRVSKAPDWALLVGVMCFVLPAVGLRLMRDFGGVHLPSTMSSLIFGIGILSAAMVISWAAEAAEKDISQALALAFLSLIAVLPEYAVDMYFTWQAPHFHEYRAFAVANMTGANRLLLGFGWSLIFFLYFAKFRRSSLQVDRNYALDLSILGAATVYSLTIFFKESLALWDTVVLFGLFITYVYMASRRPLAEPELFGPAAAIGGLAQGPRRTALVGLFLFAAIGIFASAEPFAESLLETGAAFGIDQFLLVQWLAPLASESPEILIASLFVLRGRPGVAMGALIASQVNQWTLLVGCIPLVYAISGGSIVPMPLDPRQAVEILLTAGTSALGIAVFLSLSLSKWEALLLFGTFLLQLVDLGHDFRLYISMAYLGIAVLLLVIHGDDRREFFQSLKNVVHLVRYGSPAEGLEEHSPPPA